VSYSGGESPVGAGAMAAAAAAAGAPGVEEGFNESEALEAMPVVEQRVLDDDEQVGRNDPCPCGSGKKYKKCHGA
jgi:preprotein translocase subunit SecA